MNISWLSSLCCCVWVVIWVDILFHLISGLPTPVIGTVSDVRGFSVYPVHNVPQYLHGLVSPKHLEQAALSLGYAESLLNPVLLLDNDNNLRSASVVVSTHPRAWLPSRAQASFIFIRINSRTPNHYSRSTVMCTSLDRDFSHDIAIHGRIAYTARRTGFFKFCNTDISYSCLPPRR